MYWKEIIYMSLFENEIKKECVGYLKSEKKQDKYEAEIQVKKLQEAMAGNFPIRLQSKTGWQEMGMLVVKEGAGKWNGTLADAVLRAEIIISDSKRIKGESRQEQVKQEQIRQEQNRQEQNSQERGKQAQAGQERREQEQAGQEQNKQEQVNQEQIGQEQNRQEQVKQEQIRQEQNSQEQNSQEQGKQAQAGQEQSQQEQMKTGEVKPEEMKPEERQKAQAAERQKNEQKEEAEKEEKETEAVMRAESMAMPQSRPVGRKFVTRREQIKTASGHAPLYENKWEQLLATYEQIHPYGDNRVYVKLAPKDFIVLRESYQHLVNNSFLLHGFYNYRYLILGKEGGFYLGVPGVFYEREKMVALMFGFEAFECEGGEAEEGKFGYYLRKVEL